MKKKRKREIQRKEGGREGGKGKKGGAKKLPWEEGVDGEARVGGDCGGGHSLDSN